MVKFIIAKQLVGKKVITNDGFDLGRLVDAEISEVTGKMNHILVEPTLDGGLANKLEIDGGQIKIPYSAVLAVNDFIIIDRKNL